MTLFGNFFRKPYWTGAILIGITFSFLSITLLSCRFGNNKSSPTRSTESDDGVTGFYLTQPQNLTFYVTTTNTHQGTAPISLIPLEISETFTNPVALILRNPSDGSAAFATEQGKNALPIYIDPGQKLSARWTTTPSTFWMDSTCQYYMEVNEAGSYTREANLTSSLGPTYPISGRVQVKIRVIIQFTGNCTDTFQIVSQCYQDASQCGGKSSQQNSSLQSYAIEIFGPLIQTQLMTVSDIPNVMNYAYEVEYQ